MAAEQQQLVGDVNIRVSIEKHDAIFVRVHSSDTLSNLISHIEKYFQDHPTLLECVSNDKTFIWTNDFEVENVGISPPLKFDASQIDQTIQTLGMWPGGSVRVILIKSSTMENEKVGGDFLKKSKLTNQSRPLPSELLTSHLNRFEKDKLHVPEVKSLHMIRTNTDALKQLGKASENTVRSLNRTLKAGSGGKLREMIIRQHAYGRESLRNEERFHIEVRVPSATTEQHKVEGSSAALFDNSSSDKSEFISSSESICADEKEDIYLLFWPMNWTLGKALDNLRETIPHLPSKGSYSPFVLRTNSCLLEEKASTSVNEKVRSLYLRDMEAKTDNTSSVPILKSFDTITFVTNEALKKSIEVVSTEEIIAESAMLDSDSSAIGVRAEESVVMQEDCEVQQVAETGDRDKWTVYIKHGKEEYEIDNLYPSVDTISSLKAKIVGKLRSVVQEDPKRIRLVYKGNLDNFILATLNETKLKNGCKITMMITK